MPLPPPPTPQVTKSCHCCQDQHIYVKCGSEGSACMKSYCRGCVQLHYPGLTYEDVWRECPSCRKACNCKVCLRKVSELVAMHEGWAGLPQGPCDACPATC